MELIDIVNRPVPPTAWDEGYKIPWDEPGFSLRMLHHHLSQASDAASRRTYTIEEQVDWIHNALLSRLPTRILDLACGPGLYTTRLAARGHECVGIDFSPASVAHARQLAEERGLDCEHIEADLLEADFGAGFGLVMLIFGEFNAFRPTHASRILTKAHAALTGGGCLLLEPHTWEAVQKDGASTTSWYAADSGLFSDGPHLCLEESFWDAEASTRTERYFIVDCATGDVTRHASSARAYTTEDYRRLLVGAGFADVRFYPSLTGVDDESQGNLLALTARKQASED
jgi:SAM-dependent methyltransferase